MRKYKTVQFLSRILTPEMGVIILVALLALGIRLWGVGYDLPYMFHPDEPTIYNISQDMFKSGDLNPHSFLYPSLPIYLNTLAYIPYYLLGRLTGVVHAPADLQPLVSLGLGIVLVQMPTSVLLGRLVTVVFGVGVVVLTYFAGKMVSGRKLVGALASLLAAISATTVNHSRFITPDMFVTFFIVAVLVGSVLIYQQGKTWQYILTAICVGLAASSKYNGGLVIFVPLWAHFLRHGKSFFKRPALYWSVLFCAIGFIATTPYSILDNPKFMEDMVPSVFLYSTGHVGMEGESLKWYLQYMWSKGGVLYPLAAAGMVVGLAQKLKKMGILAVFPLIYFPFISLLNIRNERTLLPVTPFLFIFAAYGLVYGYEKVRSMPKARTRRLLTAGVILLWAAAVLFPLAVTLNETIRMTALNSREVMREWIYENVPAGSKIALESYAPYLEPKRYELVFVGRMIDHEPDWYRDNGFDYLVCSYSNYGRYFAEPERYKDDMEAYQRLFAAFKPAKLVLNEGFEMRLYRVK